MLRVISGQAKGHPLRAVPGNGTRPTTDKVKEALFSMIGPYFDEEERVLDLFAGSGGLGIEALSRGAGNAVFVDSSPQSVDVVRRNLESTKLAGKASVYRNDARRALKVLEKSGLPFDLIFLDPPYAMKDCDAILTEIAQRGLAADSAIAVVEHHPDVSYPEAFEGFIRTRCAKYGEIAVSIYRYEPNQEAPAGTTMETTEEANKR
ncbi:16S rRNA (guanine(966)-N(2))-methyltransferase RsmD [Cohnella sp. LGH]|uniref:16S rRNA (guanine(966)-N(2))-methyltransferase RsmD n=1 Tax=Cohnella sp. LGH TaxID=1619153 RepID=UPI002111FDB5|nr:16S rRNA (guanine(966)-N(2))-methyltransferase RsmD [Cohnella sp. LGH]